MIDTVEIQRSLAVIERLAVALCRHRDKFKMAVDISNSTVSIKFIAHPDDSRRLVGSGGAHISEIATLAKAALKESGKFVVIEDIESTNDAATESKPFVSNEKWPKKEIESLLLDLGKACFPDRRVAIEAVDGERSTRMNLLVDTEHSFVDKFGKAVATLFRPLGKVAGRKIQADVKLYRV